METQKMPEMNRRKFIGAAATAIFAGITIQILGCDDEYATNLDSRKATLDPNYSDANPSGPNPASNSALATVTADRTGVIGTNHPAPQDHIAIVLGSQLDAGGAITLDIRGNNTTHTHTVALTAQDMTDIKNGVMVSKTSTTTSFHSHTVTFAAVTAILPGRTTL